VLAVLSPNVEPAFEYNNSPSNAFSEMLSTHKANLFKLGRLGIAKNGFEEESGRPSVQSSGLTSPYFCLLLFGIAIQHQAMTVLKCPASLSRRYVWRLPLPRGLYLDYDKTTDGEVEVEGLLFGEFYCSVALLSKTMPLCKCLLNNQKAGFIFTSSVLSNLYLHQPSQRASSR
jgi:hypothetical protein